MSSQYPKPTEREVAILRILWKTGPATVRQVHEKLNAQSKNRKVGYTTTLKFMQLIHQKGLLSRRLEGVRCPPHADQFVGEEGFYCTWPSLLKRHNGPASRYFINFPNSSPYLK
ncbi:MAG: BlaI/MecI/CopY family transcriptional regulator [Saprospiraceae bacterium]|nr:BlaI/MecI/CopY family transcriptional regulator [Saprospiraceae bacterium]